MFSSTVVMHELTSDTFCTHETETSCAKNAKMISEHTEDTANQQHNVINNDSQKVTGQLD